MSDEPQRLGLRVPFLASLVLVAVGLAIRLKILETRCSNEYWTKEDASAPVGGVRRHWREVLCLQDCDWREMSSTCSRHLC